MERNEEFVKNTAILFLGKFSAQIIAFLFLPLYTYCLESKDFGYVDLLQTYITLLVPIITLRIDSAVFRFLVDCRNDEEKKKNNISNIIYILFFSFAVVLVASVAITFIFNFKYKYEIIFNVIILMISNVLIQVLRGLGNNKGYAGASIIVALSTFIINTLLILQFNYGANSILISSSLANIICIIYVLISSKIFKYIDFKLVNKKTSLEILEYSVPMIPNALSWWVINVSDRTIISVFLGTALNGIYTVSCKFSNVINSVFLVVNMSWQENASLHLNDKDRSIYFSNIINKIMTLFFFISSWIVAVLPLVYDIVIGGEYRTSYIYVPVLLYANIVNVLSGLLGSIYVALKKTKQIAYTTFISAIVNLLVDLALIKFIGIWAAVVSTLVSYIAICIYRYVDCKKYINLKLDFKKYFTLSIIFISFSVIYYFNTIAASIAGLLLMCVLTFVIYKKDIKSGLKYIIKK